jgi:hypothetical protein
MSGANGYSRARIVAAVEDYGRRSGRGSIAALDGLAPRAEQFPAWKRALVLAIWNETMRGDGIEQSPEWWRDRATGLNDAAVRAGADPDKAREIVRGFRVRVRGRFDSFWRTLWAWARDDRRYPLDAKARAFWGVDDAPRAPPLHMGEAPFDDLQATARSLWKLTPRGALDLYDEIERGAIEQEGRA